MRHWRSLALVALAGLLAGVFQVRELARFLLAPGGHVLFLPECVLDDDGGDGAPALCAAAPASAPERGGFAGTALAQVEPPAVRSVLAVCNPCRAPPA